MIINDKSYNQSYKLQQAIDHKGILILEGLESCKDEFQNSYIFWKFKGDK